MMGVSVRPRQRAVILLAAVLAVSACGAQREEGEDLTPDAEARLTVRVRNYDFNQLTVYAIGSVQRERLGTVQSNSEETFRFRWSQPQIRIEISLLAAGSTMTDVMPVSPGDVLDLEVQISSGGRPVVRRVR
jgi:outer membrane biogenesis lipoprotein LolB